MRYLVVFDPDEVRYAQFQGTAVGMFYSRVYFPKSAGIFIRKINNCDSRLDSLKSAYQKQTLKLRKYLVGAENNKTWNNLVSLV